MIETGRVMLEKISNQERFKDDLSFLEGAVLYAVEKTGEMLPEWNLSVEMA